MEILPVMARRSRQRRTQLDRPGIAEHLGVSTATVDFWHQHRATTGFPVPADTDPTGRRWWWNTDIDSFHTAYQAARAAAFTQVHRDGDPEDLLTAPQVARVLGYADHRSLTPTLREHPDHAEPLPAGGLRRFWYRRTVWAYADSRAERHSTGRPASTTNPHPRGHPYADDPRLDAARQLLHRAEESGQTVEGLGTQLARQLGVHERTAQRLINAARRLAS
jgi:hypothetical protein